MRPIGFILLLLLLGVLGYGFWTAQKAGKLPWSKKSEPVAAAEPTPPPPPPEDPAITAWKALEAELPTLAAADARIKLKAYVDGHPLHANIWKAREALGNLNRRDLFGAGEFPGKRVYTVVSGDTLSRISAREKTTIDFLMTANGLSSSKLNIGQNLVVMQPDFSISIDLPNRCVTLEREGEFFAFYPIKDIQRVPDGAEPAEGAVSRKMAWLGGAQIAPATPKYPDAARWIVTTAKNITIFGAANAPAAVAVTPDAAGTEPTATVATPIASDRPTGALVEVSLGAAQEIAALTGQSSKVILIPES